MAIDRTQAHRPNPVKTAVKTAAGDLEVAIAIAAAKLRK